MAALEEIRQILAGYDLSIDSTVGYDENAMLREEMTTILVVAAIIILAVLTLTSRSYAEVPVLLITFGAAALLRSFWPSLRTAAWIATAWGCRCGWRRILI